MCVHRMNSSVGPPVLLDTCVLQTWKEIGGSAAWGFTALMSVEAGERHQWVMLWGVQCISVHTRTARLCPTLGSIGLWWKPFPQFLLLHHSLKERREHLALPWMCRALAGAVCLPLHWDSADGIWPWIYKYSSGQTSTALGLHDLSELLQSGVSATLFCWDLSF